MKRTMAGLTIVAALAAAPVAAQERPLGQQADSTHHPGMMQPGMMQPGMMNPGMMQMMQRMHGQGGMMGMMGGGMMGMAGGPAMILGLEESLELTGDQVERLEALRESAQSGMRQHMMQGMQTMHASQELLAGESPDVAAYEERLREAANHMVLAHTAMARAAVEARGLLTPQQQDRLALARSMMQEMRAGMMQGMMMPGMMHGMDPSESDGHGH
ncbi:MAG: Spy/CpxP family protein refolding chaperone [Guyparkeria sp.]